MFVHDHADSGVTESAMSESTIETHPDVAALLARENPAQPVYCIYPEVYLSRAAAFVSGFPGRVLYAVKANDHPAVIRLLHGSGVAHFDCASLPEIERVRSVCADATCYFMVPVRIRGAARSAFERFGVRHFMIDHVDGIDLLANEVDLGRVVIFVRMAVSHKAALQDLSSKFGAPPGDVPALLAVVRQRGAEPALAFNVGSSVTRPEAYAYALARAREVLDRLPFQLRLVDIGGGFPWRYPDFDVPVLDAYFAAIADAARTLPIADGGELMAEPGRALAAGGLSAVVEVLLRKGDRLYLNDGMYGVFWELRFKEHRLFPVRLYRNGRQHIAATRSFAVYGPTCDATDVMPGPMDLPEDVRVGDHIEFGGIGAYSLAGRTRFNGFWSDRIVCLTSPDARPPE